MMRAGTLFMAILLSLTGGMAAKTSPVLDTARGLLDGTGVKLVMAKDKSLGSEGYRLERRGGLTTLTATAPHGALYGALHLLERPLDGDTVITEVPAYATRMLNHWDNLDGTIERGYAGRSLWKWEELPAVISPRYEEYARRCATVGINATVLNNVNASPRILSREYLAKVAAIADALRPWGMKVWLSVNFASPMALDSLPTADPLDPAVQKWWKAKADEIYRLIPDFGGFLVKANSEGQPGPMDFGRTHAEGANMLARALKPHGGEVMWRAFVYSPIDADRAKQAYMEFNPLDGQFDSNVTIQIKNGPIDFQPREPASPLFWGIENTAKAVELQITQEYLGHANHAVYLGPMWREFFDTVDPSLLTAVAGVANVGDDPNMTGHPLGDANWWAFGRLAWNPRLSDTMILREWLKARVLRSDAPMEAIDLLDAMLSGSREAAVNYMMPLGLHHIFAGGHHYGPEPWYDVPGIRPDWTPKYYHQADSAGIGFDRTATGSNAVAQYPEPLRTLYSSPETCPKNLLLWFHHLPWDYKIGRRTLWDELDARFCKGIQTVTFMQGVWDMARPWVRDDEMWQDVSRRLVTQARDAQWWRDACMLYFSSLNGLPVRSPNFPVTHTLEDVMNVNLGIDNFTSPSPQLLNAKR